MDLRRSLMERLDARSIEEVSGGHQSRVFEARGATNGERVVVKVLDALLVDQEHVRTRIEVVAELARLDLLVCRPLPIGQALVTEIEMGHGQVGFVTCYEYAVGAALDPTEPSDATLMGESLAQLHHSMRQIGPTGLPLVAALRTAPSHGAGDVQLLHGDFHGANLRRVDGAVKIFDFDDCGYGPPLFDVANALYMVLFDDLTDGGLSCYRSFERSFVDGYSSVSGQAVDRDVVNRFIDLRVAALGAWLDDLATAPIGIRSATPEWHTTLRSFIGEYADRLD